MHSRLPMRFRRPERVTRWQELLAWCRHHASMSIAALSVGLLVLVAAMYEFTARGEPRRLEGVVVGLRKTTVRSQPAAGRYASVRLADGHLVTAAFDGHITLVPGSRAEMIETTTPLAGMKFYRVIRAGEKAAAGAADSR